jgi:hypothetical protein
MPGLQGQEKGLHQDQLNFSASHPADGGTVGKGEKMECPLCGCQEFFVKDPDDEFETYEFSVTSGEVRFGADAEAAPEIRETTETFCNKCSWHGKFQEVKKK